MREIEVDANALTEKAKEAFSSGHYARSLKLWTRLRTLFPDRAEHFWGMGEALRELKKFVEADHWLREGIAKFPADYGLRASFGWSAAHQGKWDEAALRFAAAVPLAPDVHSARFGLALSLRHQGELEKARETLAPLADDGREDTRQLLAKIESEISNQAVMAPAPAPSPAASAPAATPAPTPASTPSPPPIVAPQAAPTTGNENLQTMIGRIAELRKSGQLDEAARLCAEGLGRFSDNPVLSTVHAEIAQQQRDWPAALERWDKVRALLPDMPRPYVSSATALRSMGRTEDAERLLEAALRSFPVNWDIASLAAWTAVQQHDWPRAQARFELLQTINPALPDGFVGEIVVRRQAGDLDGAERRLGEVPATLQPTAIVRSEHARNAEARQAWGEATLRWQAVLADFPNEAAAHVGSVRGLTERKRYEEAEEAAAKGLAVLPDHVELMEAQADLAGRRDDAPTAAARWQAVAEKHPASIRGILGHARALVKQGRLDEAEAVIRSALARLGNRIETDIELARIAAHRRDWKVALGVLADAKRRHGDHPAVVAVVNELLWQARQDIGAQARESGTEPIEIPAILTSDNEQSPTADLKTLLLGFESLGDSCEFGMVQRRYGAEPLSLLRWTGASPANLTRAFIDKFRAFGDPAKLVLEVINGEYTTRVPDYGMFSHTFSLASATPFDSFFPAQCRRMGFLRDKLLEDIKSGEKILTYGSAQLDDASIASLHAAIHALSPAVTLLCVRQASEAHPAGTVKSLSDTLLVGAVSRFSTTDIAFEEWLAVCQGADSLRAISARG